MSKLKVSAIHDPDNDNLAIGVDSSGKVGIGTTSPMVALNVHDSTNSRIALTNSSTGQTFPDGFELLATGTDAYIQNRSNGPMIFTTNNTERMRITSDGRGLSQFTAKAWVNFSGQGTIAIRDSHNVSSLTDNGTGDYSINFSNNMGNTHYCVASTGRLNQGTVANVPTQQSTSSTRCQTYYQHNNTYSDNDAVQLVIFGD